ncbi:MAG: caffeoyl-CoA O-methyltransferase [Solirubrobacteraceae bacterium]|jgi:caffeoyl-CoA O-methyltransferase|nr:caffeoyl-CoA O-methyltransferase [Solirubrobacteraceae bacterium]
MVRGPKTTFSPDALEYLAQHSRQDDVLAEVERETAERSDAMMQISPDQGALMTLLAKLVGASNALEVGTFTGYSAICIGRGLADDGALTCLELDADLAAIARRNIAAAGLEDRVAIRVGPAKDSLEAMPEEPTYDYVFLDADKQTYPDYYELILPRMKQGGLLLIDNMLLGGRVLDPQDDRSRIVDELNDRIANDERVDQAMVLVADGVTFVRKR